MDARHPPRKHWLTSSLQLAKYMKLDQKGKVLAEYIWIDGTNGLRNKTKVSTFLESALYHESHSGMRTRDLLLPRRTQSSMLADIQRSHIAMLQWGAAAAASHEMCGLSTKISHRYRGCAAHPKLTIANRELADLGAIKGDLNSSFTRAANGALARIHRDRDTSERR